MKKLLSLLMCYVFLQAQTFALRGGPSGKNGLEKVQGAYSGTLVEVNPPAGTVSSVGLFLLTAVDNGASSGQVVFFAASTTDVATYTGTIAGVSNPNNGKFTAVFGASDATGQLGSQTISGQMIVTASKAANTSFTQTISGTATGNYVNIITSGNTIIKTVGNLTTYTVDGWRTSATDVGNPFPTTF